MDSWVDMATDKREVWITDMQRKGVLEIILFLHKNETASRKDLRDNIGAVLETIYKTSLIENLEILRKSMNPIARAKRLNEIISFSAAGLRSTARRLGIGASTLSEWLKVLELSEKMQDAVEKGLLVYSDALTLAKMRLGTDLQDKLAQVLETEGLEAFQRELSRIPTGKMKRGIPKGVYQVDRVIWDKRNREEMGFYETLTRAAEAKEKKVPEFIKAFLLNHAEEIKREIA